MCILTFILSESIAFINSLFNRYTHICTDIHRFNINYNMCIIYKYILYFWNNLQLIYSTRIIITQLLN